MDTLNPFLVIGGGPGGLATDLALSRKGFPVHVLEKAHEFGEIGAGMTMFDRVPTDNWTRHHITLLGDSAHPMLQYIAQGACQALEDAVCLADTVASQHGDVEAAFRLYQNARRAVRSMSSFKVVAPP